MKEMQKVLQLLTKIKQQPIAIRVVISLFILVVAVLVGINVLFRAAEVITDFWWFSEVGYSDIFIKLFMTTVIIGVMVLIHILIVHKSILKFSSNPIYKGRKGLLLFFGIVWALFTGLSVQYNYLKDFKMAILNATAPTIFGKTDPLFHLDISFYFFSLPVITALINYLEIIVLSIFLPIGFVYIKTWILRLRNKQKNEESEQIDYKQINWLLVLLIGLRIIGLILGSLSSVHRNIVSNGYTGPYFTEVIILIWNCTAGMLVLLSGLAISVRYAKINKQFPYIKIGIALLFVFIVFPLGIAWISDTIFVNPNEYERQKKYLSDNITSTLDAYRLNDVKEIDIDTQELSQEDIDNNQSTLKSVRLWDRDKLLEVFAQTQEIRPYYTFSDIDDERYTVNGELRQVISAPRNLSQYNLTNPSWINNKLVYTHGYGMVATFANELEDSGLPKMIVKDMPVRSDYQELEIDRPEVYYPNYISDEDYIIVNTKLSEFNYPTSAEEGGEFSHYSGSGGIKIDSFWKRIILALRNRSWEDLMNQDITKESQMLIHRDILERIDTIAPFLLYDSDPYLVIAEGKLYWIIDAYSISDLYPYATLTNPYPGEDIGPINYIRNSVKVVVDPYSGKVDFYVIDPENDPLIQTYMKVFKTAFKPIEEMPDVLQPHLRYPEILFKLQTALYETYHMKDPAVFYRREDAWQEATSIDLSLGSKHLVMTLPGEQDPEFIFLNFLTPKGKNNLAAWIAARSDGDKYGQLVVYKFSKQKFVYGPRLIMSAADQNEEISKMLTLWNQSSTETAWGSLFAVPIGKTILYVRPLYLLAKDAGSIPQIKKVVVIQNDKVTIGDTFEEALMKQLEDIDQTDSIDEPALEEEMSEPKENLIP